MAGLLIGFLVEKCAACHQNSDFGWHRSQKSKTRLSFSLSLMRERVEKMAAG